MAQTITIYDDIHRPILDAPVTADSNVEENVMGDRKATLHFTLERFVEFPLNSYIVFGESGNVAQDTFTMVDAPEVTIHNRNQYEYTLTFLGTQSLLARVAMVDAYAERYYISGDPRPKVRYVANIPAGEFSLTATPAEHIQKVCDAMRIYDREWEVLECDAATEQAVTFSNCNCGEALNMIAEAFESEWYVIGKGIGLKKRRLNSGAPLELAYGKGNGLVSGVRKVSSEKKPISRLYVNGTDRNIIKADYGQKRLVLPRVNPSSLSSAFATIDWDGEHTSLEREYNPQKKKCEIQIDWKNRAWIGDGSVGIDAFFSDDSVYPAKEHEVTGFFYQYRELRCVDYETLVTTYPDLADTDNDEWDNVEVFVIAGANDVNYKGLKADDGQMTMIFQSGELAGKEFTISEYIHNAVGSTYPARRFVLDRTNIDGYNMPIPPFVPESGDTFAVFGVKLPQEYYDEAEIKLLNRACKYLYENNREKYSIAASLDGIWATTRWDSVGPKIVLGGCVNFTDTEIQPTPFELRITRIVWPLLRTHAPEVEFTNDFRDVKRKARRAKQRSTDTGLKNRTEDADLKTRRIMAKYSRTLNRNTCVVTDADTYVGKNDRYVSDMLTATTDMTIHLPANPTTGQQVTLIKTTANHATIVKAYTGPILTANNKTNLSVSFTAAGIYEFIYTDHWYTL